MNLELYSQLTDAEKEFHNALMSISEKYGALDNEELGIWVGYESAAENEDASIGVKCANCTLYNAPNQCAILSYAVEPGAKCRLAVIPPGYVNASPMNKSFWGGKIIEK
jgi:hypothetical protein